MTTARESSGQLFFVLVVVMTTFMFPMQLDTYVRVHTKILDLVSSYGKKSFLNH